MSHLAYIAHLLAKTSLQLIPRSNAGNRARDTDTDIHIAVPASSDGIRAHRNHLQLHRPRRPNKFEKHTDTARSPHPGQYAGHGCKPGRTGRDGTLPSSIIVARRASYQEALFNARSVTIN